MAMEVRAGRCPIFLDMTHFTPEDVKKIRTVLPIPSCMMERAGVLSGDRIVKKIEWQPAVWGTTALGGGVVVDTRCETSLPGLFACGDSIARPMSKPSALPGAAVTGARAGEFGANYAENARDPEIEEGQLKNLRNFAFSPLERTDGIEPDHLILKIQEALFPYEVTVITRGERLQKAVAEIEKIRDEEVPLVFAWDAHYLRLANEVKSMVLVAEMFLKSRLLRKESRNTYLREDFPETDNVNWLKNTRLKLKDGKMALWMEDVPLEKCRFRPRRKSYLHPIFEAAKKRGITWG
jgi:succinate dehydrogenase/fumarate reductase flavoprotein subunit